MHAPLPPPLPSLDPVRLAARPPFGPDAPAESAAALHHVLRCARARGGDVQAVAASLGLDLDAPAELARRLPIEACDEAWRAALAADGELAFAAATESCPATIALFAYLATSFRTVREAIAFFARNAERWSPRVRLRLDVEPSRARLALEGPDPTTPGGRATAELWLAFIAHLLHLASAGRFSADASSFGHVGRPPARPIAALGAVRFERGRTELLFPPSRLDLSLDFASGLYRALGAQPGDPGLSPARVRLSIQQSLAERRRPTLHRTAASLKVTPRALQRALRGGPSFQALVSDVCGEMALALLRSRADLSVKEIAARFGFSETGAFSRFFTRWYGRAPSQVRAEPRAATMSSAPPRAPGAWVEPPRPSRAEPTTGTHVRSA